MKFTHGARRQASVYEKELVKYWKENRIFEESVTQRPIDKQYVFYDGPPFITNVPHSGNLLASIIKDAIPRYQTMKGFRVERVWGWDCHGLPAEVATERKLGIKDKRDVGTKISLEDYIKACRDNMVQTGSLWNDTIDRVGRWVDMEKAYKTMDKEYMESVWWAFKQLYDKGKIYEGVKVLMYCTRDETPLAKAEIAMDNSYQDVTDPSVYVKFKLKNDNSYLLAWTTTPWTLPANTAIVVNKDFDYVEVEVAGDKLILAKDTLERALRDDTNKPVGFKVIREFKGQELVGKSYDPLFEDRGKNAHKVWHADFVHLDEGTGIAHEAPAYGEDDFTLSQQNSVPIVLNTDERGVYTEGDWAGELVWDVNKDIAKTLKERGIVWRIEYITHPYPHCHRCGTKLMYRAHPSWFMDIAGQRQQMLEKNDDIYWFPQHIKKGRFAKTVQSAPDWNLSRDRFWATAMPVWKGTDKDGHELIKVIGSYAELKDLSGVELDDYHRPWIDDVTFTIDQVEYKRIDKVMDSWFEAGSMPFAQFHYPFENVDKFESSFPGDFIAEYIGQVRAWFYYLHAVSVGLFGDNSFKNVVVTGTLAGNDGRKMSKSYGNYVDPNELMDSYSADALRYLLLSSSILNGEDYALVDKDVADIHRKLSMVWNMYDFFTMYAEVDGWQWDGKEIDPGKHINPLDDWALSRLHETMIETEKHMQAYDLPNALKPILPFIDDASNWYVRRSRRRFWKSQNDSDKQTAYSTLHYVLRQLAHLLAPFTPFLAEELYIKLTGKKSVHLNDWPLPGHINQLVLNNMASARQIITQGLAQRAQAGIKVRQPLSKIKVVVDTTLDGDYQAIIKDELNVKQIELSFGKTLSVDLDIKITTDLKEEGVARDLIRAIQELRKTTELAVDDRIKLHVSEPTDSRVLDRHKPIIMAETLTQTMSKTALSNVKKVKINNQQFEISLQKV
ncbi:MAG TPA: isoleucine--tRNA ligase [Candidatus Saccharimonadales bacterium]